MLFFIYLKREKERADANRQRLEHEAWLRTPGGMAWQEQERERLRKEEEEAERCRKEAEEMAARENWRRYHESKTLDDIAAMSGREFEEFLARLFSRMGYRDAKLTPANDQGADLVCLAPHGGRVAIQAKRWKGTVGNEAVQQLLGAMVYYGCVEGIVVTNSSFTAAARALAGKDSRITLCDRRWLAEQIKLFLPPQLPPFSWEEYARVVQSWHPLPKDKRWKSGRRRRSTGEGGPRTERDRNRQTKEPEEARVAPETRSEWFHRTCARLREQRRREAEGLPVDPISDEEWAEIGERLKEEKEHQEEIDKRAAENTRLAVEQAKEREQRAAEAMLQHQETERKHQEQQRVQRDADQAVERLRQRQEVERIEQEQQRLRWDAERAADEMSQRREIEPVLQPATVSQEQRDEPEQEDEQESALAIVQRLRELYCQPIAGEQDPVLRPHDPLCPLVELGEHWGYLTYRHVSDYLRVQVFRIEPKGVKVLPDDAANRERLGRLLSALDNRDIPLIEFTELDATGRPEKDAHFFYERGTSRFEKGEYDKAFEDFDAAIEVDPAYALLLTPKYERAQRESETLAQAWEVLTAEARSERGSRSQGDDTADWDNEDDTDEDRDNEWDNIIRAYEDN
jgi:hypothetical protein